MNLDKYIKQLFISLSKFSQYYDITITTFEKYNEEYNCISKSMLLQFKEPHPTKKDHYFQYKEWYKNKQELVVRLSKLWQSQKQTKNKKK